MQKVSLLRHGEHKEMENGKWKMQNQDSAFSIFHFRRFTFFIVFLFISALIFSSCKTQKTDLRTLAPNDALVYLETEDLGKTLGALTENKAWENLARQKPDFSRLENVPVAVAVTGFETSEKQVTDESSVLDFKPRFVAIADTHQWNWTTVSVAENQIGQFAKNAYGDDVKLEKSEKADAEFFVWTSRDGRKLFAAVSGSVIYAGNDEGVLDKCLAVKKGAAENLSKNESLARAREESSNDENRIAFGYVSPEGVAQIADLAGVSLAIKTSEENLPRSFVAKILPDILRKTTREIVWTARKSEQGIEDKISVKTDAETSSVLTETLAPSPNPSPANESQAAEFLPLQFESVTRYNLQNPQIAWRSALFVAAKQTDAGSAKMLLQFSSLFFEPYGVADGEMFLSAIDTPILTAQLDESGENRVVVAPVKNIEQLKKSLAREINFKSAPEKVGAADIWQATDEDLAAAFVEGKLILGEKQSVLDCLRAKESEQNFAKTVQFQRAAQSSAAAASVTKDAETAQKVVAVFGVEKETNKKYASFYTTETRFTGDGIERRTVSDFGLIGTIVEKFGGEN